MGLWCSFKDWIQGRTVERCQRDEMIDAWRMARFLMATQGYQPSDQLAWEPVRASIQRRIGVGHRLYHSRFSPWMVPLAVPPVLVVLGGSQRTSFTLTAVVWTIAVAQFGRSLKLRVLLAQFSIGLAVGLTSFLWFMVVRLPNEWDAPWLFPQMGKVALAVFLFVEIPLLVWLLVRHRIRIDRECHPHDSVVLGIVQVTYRIHCERMEWRSSRACRRWVGLVDGIAVDASVHLALGKRADMADRRLRYELRAEAEKIATGIRLLKKELATASSEADIVAVVGNLTRGMIQIARYERTVLLSTAPAVLAPSRSIARIFSGLLSALPLFIAAWLVPMIPQIASSPQLAQAAMWSLVVSGVIALIPVRAEAGARIHEVVGRSLPSS